MTSKEWASHGCQESSQHCSKAGRRGTKNPKERVGWDGVAWRGVKMPKGPTLTMSSSSITMTCLSLRALPTLPFSGWDNPTCFLGQQKCWGRCLLDRTQQMISSDLLKKWKEGDGQKRKECKCDYGVFIKSWSITQLLVETFLVGLMAVTKLKTCEAHKYHLQS